MLWNKSRPQRRPKSFRPAIEPLESRLAMAASIVPFTDFDGSAGVRVTDGSASSQLIINDNVFSDIQTLTLIQKGKPNIEVKGAFRVFDIDMGGGNDSVKYQNAVQNFEGDRRDFHINLGSGRNVLDFQADGVSLTKNSRFGLDIQGGNSNDFIDVEFSAVLDSVLTVTGRLGGGADGELNAQNKVVGPSRFSVGKGSLIYNSSVLVDFDLGSGSNDFEAGINGDFGIFGTLPASQAEVNIVGSNKAGDKDQVTLDLTSTMLCDGGALAIHVDLLAGNDFFTGIVPSTFDIFNDGNLSGGAALLDVDGGQGNDQISVTRDGSVGPAFLDGLFTLLLAGGEGNDTINVDFGAPDYFQTFNSPTAQDRGLRLRASGGAGNDSLNVQVANDNSATFFYDLQLLGGTGNDNVTLSGVNNGGNPSFGPNIGKAGVVLLDGGLGTDLRKVTGNFGAAVLKVGFEGVLP